MTTQTIHFPISIGTKLWQDAGEPFTVVGLMGNDKGQKLMMIERGIQSQVVDTRLIGVRVFETREGAEK